jgi:anti-sigma factor RsiW
MDAEVLERLLLDRALGALPPDVESLLTDYLERDRAAAARAREYESAAADARRVLGSPAAIQLPPFPAARMGKVERTRRRLVLIRNVGGLAAALVIGVGLGAGLLQSGPTARSDREHPMLQPAPAPMLAAAAASSARPGGFWSAERLYEAARSAKRSTSAHVVWESPISEPSIGG